MSKIYKTSSDKNGFRLQYMEVLNWGTFHSNQIFKIEPKGHNSLLTGANGSGKTTFIDALLTLLIPAKNERFYNQSSGVLKKGDRTEESYVLGHYGAIQNEGELSASSQRLREKNTFSILLASFSDNNNNTVTLFQVRWFSSTGLQREFGISYAPLRIENDFLPFDPQRKWKKSLIKKYNEGKVKNEIQFISKIGSYSERIVKLFGMRSRNALKLFNQIVGIKVLGDLNEFIRSNMLEKKDAEKKYIDLKESFINLSNAKNEIDKAQEQIRQLEPIDKAANRLTEIERHLNDLHKNREIAVYWFTEKGRILSKKKKQEFQNTLKVLEEKLAILRREELVLNEKKIDLRVQIETNEKGRQIEDLKKEIALLEKTKTKQLTKSQEYNLLVKALSLNGVSDKNSFSKNQKVAQERITKIKLDKERAENRQFEIKTKAVNLKEELKNAEEEIRFLNSNKSNISWKITQIRDKIVAQLGATKHEIPFIGELLKVNQDQKDWERSIEKVLHNFALQLIVPQKYYHQVNQYVNKTNLRGRIVYQHYKGFSASEDEQIIDFEKQELISKISFKTDNQYRDWLVNKVKKQFNYTCVRNLSEFHDLEKAITREGLIKYGKGKHEKDDRKHILSKENYVLGWDNQEKLSWWKGEFKKLQAEEVENKTALRQINKTLSTLENSSKNYTKLMDVFTEYEQIDWQTSAKAIATKTTQKTALENSDNKLKTLQKQLKTVDQNLTTNQKSQKSQEKTAHHLEKEIGTISKEEAAYTKTVFNLLTDKPLDLPSFEKSHRELLNINYSNFSKKRSEFQNNTANAIKEFEREKNNLSNQTLSKMRKFKQPSKQLSEQYKNWNSDVSNLSEAIESIDEYQSMYQNLCKENLPKFQTQFNEYLKEIIEGEVAMFRTFLSTWQSEIEENIAYLNEALIKIDYPSNHYKKAYIKLVAQHSYSFDIKELRNLLDKAISNIAELNSTTENRKQHFENNIEPLIKKLADEKWRNKVLDVRSWFTYKVFEMDRASNEKNIHDQMGQLSGGEKAKLTYTILASAIAYQFALTQENHQKTFRFIAIDEAFKAQDEKNSGYLIELCKQLGLQLLVVTPSDNIHIVEKEISFVHFVERRVDKTSWLYDMTIKEFQQLKEKYTNP